MEAPMAKHPDETSTPREPDASTPVEPSSDAQQDAAPSPYAALALPPGLVDRLRSLPGVDVAELRRIGGIDTPAYMAWLQEQSRQTDANQKERQALDEDRRALDRMLAEEMNGPAAVVKAVERLGRQMQSREDERTRQIEKLEQERARQIETLEQEHDRQQQKHAAKVQELEGQEEKRARQVEKLGRQIKTLEQEREQARQQRRKQRRKRRTQKQTALPSSRKMQLTVQIADDLRREGGTWVTEDDLLRQINSHLNDRPVSGDRAVTIGRSTLQRARAWSKKTRGADL
jgi:hypothetical protein